MSAESPASRAVFLSYASQDAEAARRMCATLRAAGAEVWFDQNELVGGDAWDAKIRKQISECGLFVPIISANTQVRDEGYFRLEWKLAVDRSHLMVHDKAFLLPVVIDATSDAAARVPPEFRAVQWTRLPGGETPATFAERVKILLGSKVARAFQPVGSADDTGWKARATPKVGRRVPAAAWGVAMLALMAAAVVGWRMSRPLAESAPISAPNAGAGARPPTSDVSAAAPATENDKAVAVLPFANLSGDKDQEYFSDGLTEEILNALARERDLRVPGRASSFSFKGKNTSEAEMARALNVTRLVEGSVQRAGNHVRIRVTLWRASDGFSEALGGFDKEMTDGSAIFALEDEVARAVVEKLTRRTATAAPVAVLTKNPEAYDAYLRGRALQTRAANLWPDAAAQYERAVALDPAFALAWARLAAARFRDYSGLFDQSPEIVKTTRTAIDRALAAQPNLPDALIMRANWARETEGGFAAAQRDLARAEELGAATAELRFAQALLARDTGNWPEARRRARETLELDPQNGDYTNTLAMNLYQPHGDFAEADRLYARAIVIQGPSIPVPFHNRVVLRTVWRGPEATLRLIDRAPAGQVRAGLARAEVLAALGRVAEARGLIDAIEREAQSDSQALLKLLATGTGVQGSLPLLRAVGREPLARTLAEEVRAKALAGTQGGNHAPYVWRSLVQAEETLGHREAALAALEEWRRETGHLPSVFRRLHEFDRLACPLYAALGQADEAIALLHECAEQGYQVDSNLRYGLEFAPIRNDPRFQELIKQQEAWAKAQPDPVDL